MSTMRGLYLIRSGIGRPTLTTKRADDTPNGDEQQQHEDGRIGTLEVDFSRFDTWYEIDSFWEGRFLERTARGAFRKTIAERANQVKVLFNHGMDMFIHSKPLGVIELLEERQESPHLEAPLLDTSYNRDLLPGLRAGAYGSSFMFEVLGESWEREPEESEHNPEGLPERTITEVRLYEAGPVTWPANPEATAGVRSGVDWYAEQVAQRDADQYDELVRSFQAFRALNGLDTPKRAVTPSSTEPEPPASDAGSDRHVDGAGHAAARARRLQLIDLARR